MTPQTLPSIRLADRLRRIIDGMPEGGSFTLPVDAVREWLADDGPAPPDHDFSVVEIAERYGRSPITVRGWIAAGRLKAYLFQGREHRITPAALAEFHENSRTGEFPEE